MKTLIFDNYDSFTYNLYHYVQQLDEEVEVRRNDEISLDEIDAYEQIILSPGPGTPETAHQLLDVVKRYYKSKKMLGICLGHQALAMAFGAQLINLNNVLHGRKIRTFVNSGAAVFQGLPGDIFTGRYHSFVINPDTLPPDFEIIAMDEMQTIQAIQHREYALTGFQFHPESVLTPQGFQMIKNWL
jgi:anthranilate synthase component 2